MAAGLVRRVSAMLRRCRPVARFAATAATADAPMPPPTDPSRIVFRGNSDARALLAQHELYPGNLARLLYKTLRFQTRLPGHVDDLRVVLDRLLAFAPGRLTLRTVANVLRCIATYDRRFASEFDRVVPAMIQALREHAGASSPPINSSHLTSILHSVSVLGLRESSVRRVLADLAAASAAQVGAFHPQDLPLVAWGFTVAGVVDHALLDAIARHAVAAVPTLNAYRLSILVWSFAKAQHSAADLFDAVAGEASARLHQFDGKNVSNLVWAFARAGRSAPALFEQLTAALPARLRDTDAQGIATVVWAFARVGYRAPDLFRAVADVVVGDPRDPFNAQALANIAWAYAKAGVNAPALFARIASAASRRWPTFSAHNVSTLAWAFASAPDVPVGVFDAIAARALPMIDAFSSVDLANLAWAFANVGHAGADALYEAVARALCAPRLRDAVADHHLINTLYALALADRASIALTTGAAALLPDLFASGFDPALGARAHLWRLSLTDEQCGEVRRALPRTWDTLARCQRLYREAPTHEQYERLAEDVSAAIAATTLRFVARRACPRTSCIIDFAYDEGERRVALVLHGAWAFRGARLNAAAALRQRVLAAHGWRVVPINAGEWDARDTNDKAYFIETAVASALLG
ncbi:RAP domain-containing protein [Plasmodiophora brassicae]